MEKVVITVDELKKMVKNNEENKIDEVDVVTAGTCGIMSGTLGIFHIPIGESFKKAEKFYLNGIEGYPGPCPNEFLGSVDCTIYGTKYFKNYGGGFLFKELISGKEVETVVESDGKTYRKMLKLEDMPTARFIGTRNAFKNYVALTNTGEPVNTIFHRKMLKPGEASFSGCGEINPLQNMNSDEKYITGKKILVNGAEGIILGYGTRSSKEKPNMMISADMHEMDEYYIGGFVTSAGAEIFNTIAVPIEVNEKNKEYLKTIDSEIELPLTNVFGRTSLGSGKYSEVWENAELRPKVDINRCRVCDYCEAQRMCPTNAIVRLDHLGKRSLPNENCFGCGVCVDSCAYGVYKMDRKSIMGIPITCRQSDRVRALKLVKELKKRIEKEEFKI
uniref:Methanogenesis marker 16 metalloprotein n=1 Tax=Methanococcus maripaludis (strain C6 / ATCC BAA-1332) TaxID=444158 RepID=A9A958_METM6